MRIHSLRTITFKGLWEPVKTHHKDTGVYYKNKVQYTLHECVYHPWSDESDDEIRENTDKHFLGRRFSLMETYDMHWKNDVVQMNLVKIGDRINREDSEEYIKKGYSSDLVGGIIADKTEFWKTYSNPSYEPFDVYPMSKEKVEETVATLFEDVSTEEK